MWNENVLLTVRIIFVSLQYLSFSATDLVHHTAWRCSSEPGLYACLYNLFFSLHNKRVLLEEVPTNLNHHASRQSISTWPSIHCGICSSHSCLFVASLKARARGRKPRWESSSTNGRRRKMKSRSIVLCRLSKISIMK